MISFIVIGRNEGEKIVKCLVSIFETIIQNEIKDYEIIYVDSNSNDNSIELVRRFNQVRIFKIINVYNAAIARNIGFKESKGDILFFIDGDMELISGFLKHVLNHDFTLKYDFVSGQFINVLYDSKGNYLGEHIYNEKYASKDRYFATTGGIFLIKRELWELVDGMNNKYKRSQDIDFALRLAKKGIFLLRKKEVIAKHYTIDYIDKVRMWKMLFSGAHFYAKGLLYREHIFNKHIYQRIIRHDSTAVIFVVATILTLCFSNISFYSLYIIAVICRILLQKKNSFLRATIKIPYYIVSDIITTLSFLFFYPKQIDEKKVRYVNMSEKGGNL